MIQVLRRRTRRDDRGFTLVELLVVALVLGVLIVIAVPTFLSARTRADNREAQSVARNVLTAARILYADASTYGDAEAALPTIEPTYTYLAPAAPSNDVEVVSVGVTSNDQELGIAVMATSGTCYVIHDVVGVEASPFYGSTTDASLCTANHALTVTSGTTW